MNGLDSESRLTLDEQLCFALYAATNAVTRSYRPLLGQIGLTYPQYLVMLVLWQDGPRSPSGIAERLKLPRSAITPLLDRLEAAGLLVRARDSGDRRYAEVRLTAAGAGLETAAARIQQEVVCQTGLAPAALDALRDQLAALVGRIEAQSSAAAADRRR